MGRTSESEGVGEHSCSPWSMCGCGWCSSLVFSRVPPSRAPSSRVSSSRAPSSRVPSSCVLPSRVPSSCVPPSRVLPSRVPSSRVPSSCVLFFLGWPSSWGSPLSGVALFLGLSSFWGGPLPWRLFYPQAGAPDFAMSPLSVDTWSW